MPFLQDIAVALIKAAADTREYMLRDRAIKREKRISDLPASKREKPYRALIEEINHFLEGITNDEVKVDLRRLKTSIETQKIPQAQSAMLATQDSPRVEQCKDACFLLTCAAYCPVHYLFWCACCDPEDKSIQNLPGAIGFFSPVNSIQNSILDCKEQQALINKRDSAPAAQQMM